MSVGRVWWVYGIPAPFSIPLCTFEIFIRTHALKTVAKAKEIIKRKRRKEEHRKDKSLRFPQG